jgi:drug/metabolite transporter, DME family
VVVAAALLGTAGTAAALGPDALAPEAAAAWRTVIGGVGLVAGAALWGRPPWRYPLHRRLVVVGGVGVAVNQLAFFAGIERAGVAVGTLVTIGAVPVAAGILDWWGAARPGPRWVSGVVVAVAGVGLLTGSATASGSGSGPGERVAWSGVALAALAGTSAAVFGRAAQRLMDDRPVLPAMATVVAAGAVLLLPLALADTRVAFGTRGAVATVAFLGLVTTGAAYALWGTGLERLSLGAVAAVTLLEPAVAAVLATTVLREPVTVTLVAGIALVLAGVAIASHRHTPPAQRPLRDHPGGGPA